MKSLKLSALALALGLSACSSGVKRADIPSTANPSDEVARLESDIGAGLSAQYDVLAPDEFARSQKYLSEAKSDMASNSGQREVLEDVSYGQGFLIQARDKAATRATQIPGLLEARQKALTAGARDFPPTRQELGKLDDRMRGHAGNFEKIDADKFSTLQNQYLDLELSAVKNTQLGKAQAQVTGAHKASNFAPKSLKKAELDLKNAENMIAANRNSPETFSKAVSDANQSAGFLTAILAATQNGKVDEKTATDLVNQQRRISGLQGELQQANSNASQMGETLAKQGKQLSDNARTINLQKSLEHARQEFSKDEADVFQQGDKLLIRLKNMNFTSGGSDLPSDSLAVLAKVKDVAQELGPKSIVVEGHTDSVGGKAINQKISQTRASTVAKYLNTNGIEESATQSVGYGFSKPIASNKSAAGRAQNRRVDIVITPGASNAPASGNSNY